ncbi:MAG: hypothetical protein E7013_01935 [Alphaproteobacteria bacterium]|nr:hypothetical protein [Alphaproteobacteria bacterium]
MAKVKDDIAYIWDGIKMSASEGWTDVKVAKGKVLTGAVSSIYRGFSALGSGMKQGMDKSLIQYIPKDDLAFMKENNVHLYSSDRTTLAGHQTALNAIVINPKSFKELNNNAACETYAHHEVQHARDIKKLEKNGFSATDLGHGGSGISGLDRSSQLLLQGVLEARAYSEQMGFIYDKKQKENSAENRNAYYYFVDTNSYGKAFDDAIRQGKTTSEAKRAAAVELLNSDFLKKNYIEPWANKLEQTGKHKFSVDGLLGVLGEDLLTKEDLMKADKFWENISAYDDVKKSDMYLEYQAQKRARDYQEKKLAENKTDAQIQTLTPQDNMKNEQQMGLKARLSALEVEKNTSVAQQESTTSLKDSLKTASVANDSGNNAGTNNAPTAVQIASAGSQGR